MAAAVLLLGGGVNGLSQEQPAAAEKKPKWESSAAAGLTLTSGNSETFMATLTAATMRKWEKNELSFGLDGA